MKIALIAGKKLFSGVNSRSVYYSTTEPWRLWMPSFGIVSGADKAYFHLLRDMLRSVSACAGKLPTSILDFGLTAPQREELQDLGCRLLTADWDLKIKAKVATRDGNRIETDETFKAYTSRPFLPRYVEEETILWIDADMWVQDGKTIDIYVAAAATGKLAITLEMDRAYSSPFWRYKSLIKECVEAFGPLHGLRLGRKLPANSGIFALRADAPHWELWQRAIRRSMKWFPGQRKEQIALNYVIFIDNAPTYFLPARFNWMVWEARPIYDVDSGLLVEPQPPYEPISVIHMATGISEKVFPILTTRGDVKQATLRYSDWKPA